MAINARHLRLISRQAASNSIRSGTGLVFLLSTLLFGLLSAQMIIAPVEMMQAPRAHDPDASPSASVDDFLTFARPAVTWILGGKIEPPSGLPGLGPPPAPATPAEKARQRWVSYLLDEKPALLSAILLVFIFGIPLLVPFVAFNQVSGDAQSRGLRYLLLRTERANIFFGRYLGTVAFSILVVAITLSLVTLYLGLRIAIYPAGPLFGWALRGFLAVVLLLLPYVALCALLSALIDSPFVSLLAAGLIIGGTPVLAWLASTKWPPAGNLQFLTPWGIQNYLLHPDPSHAVTAASGCLAYTAIFLFLGHLYFARRDL